MKPSATSGTADVTQVISPQRRSAHAHSQDGNSGPRPLATAGLAASNFSLRPVPLGIDSFGPNVYLNR